MSKYDKHEHKHGDHPPPPPPPPANTGDVTQTNENTATVTVSNEQNVTGVDIDLVAKYGGKIDVSHFKIDSDVWAKQENDTTITITQSGNSVEATKPITGDVTQDNTNNATVDVSNVQNVTGVDFDLTASGWGKIDVSHFSIDSDVHAYQSNETTVTITQSGNDYAFG